MSILHLGDCLEVMGTMEGNSVDAIISDPPYGLSFMGAKWDSFGGSTGNETVEERRRKMNEYLGVNAAVPAFASSHGRSPKLSEMQDFQAAMTPIFGEALRVAKPGAYLLCFGGTRTFHRMACAIEDAGWTVRDCIMWVYGQGFPHGMDIAKAIDKKLGAKREVVGRRPEHVISKAWREAEGRTDLPTSMLDITVPATDQAKEWEGWNTALKPAWEPIIVAQKPVEGTIAENVLKWGTGAMNIDACRVPIEQGDDVFAKNPHTRSKGKDSGIYGKYGAEDRDWSGERGRYPANVAHDGSQMVLDLFPDTEGIGNRKGGIKAQTSIFGHESSVTTSRVADGAGSAARYFNTFRDGEESAERTYADRGSTDFAAKPGMRRAPADTPARFFYCAKASKKDRGEGNHHPTVKPTALMEWLVKLVTPEGGVVLDPFMGSGSTGVACANLGRRFVGIEREWEYMQIAGPRVQNLEREVGMLR